MERQPARAELARKLGADMDARDLGELDPASYDVVVDATGVLSVMAHAVVLARRGHHLLFGVPPRGRELSLDAFAIFEKGLTIRSSSPRCATPIRPSSCSPRAVSGGRSHLPPVAA